GRQRDGAGLGTLPSKVLEELADRFLRRGHVANFDARRFRQALLHLGLLDLEDERIGAEAWDVARGVKAVERVIELVGQEDLFERRFLENLCLPVLLPEDALGGVAERIGVRGRDAVALEAEERAND